MTLLLPERTARESAGRSAYQMGVESAGPLPQQGLSVLQHGATDRRERVWSCTTLRPPALCYTAILGISSRFLIDLDQNSRPSSEAYGILAALIFTGFFHGSGGPAYVVFTV
jgi:hypothetical protein